MNNLMEIKTTKTSFLKMESELLIVGLFKDKKLNSELKNMDVSISNQLLHAMERDAFIGKKDDRLSIYGNESIKRILLIGLGEMKNYNTDRARSIRVHWIH